LSKPDTVEIVTPIVFFSDKIRVCIDLKTATGKTMTGPNPCPPLSWTEAKEHEYGEQITRVAKGVLPLISPQSVKVDESNRAVEQSSFSAQ
jgi:hypothetical protein